MSNLAVNALANNITTDYIQSITDRYNSIYYSPGVVFNPDSYNFTITTSTCPTKLETDSNELKINIKKFQIKFNFNL